MSAPSPLASEDDTTAFVPPHARDDGFSDEADATPATLGRYVLGRVLGQGGMGSVYAAFDPELRRDVAIKLLVNDTGRAHERMLREARAMAQLAHPNVVPVYFVGRDLGRPYIVMELVEGSSLAGWIRARPRTSHEVLDVFEQTDGHPTEGWTRHGLGQTLAALGHPDLARVQLERAIDVLVRALGEDVDDVRDARVSLRALDDAVEAKRGASR